MLNLTNLDLSKTGIKTLPKSLFKLKRLQVLVIRDCEHLKTLPSEIGQITTLEVLDLQGTELLNLPDTVTELSKLKSLKVSFYGTVNQLERNNLPRKLMKDGTISSLPLLEELGMFVHFEDRRWITSASDITREVTRLMLSTLYFCFPKLENLDYFLQGSRAWKNEEIKNFNFIVGTDIKRVVPLVTREAELMHSSSERCLRFVNGEAFPRGVVEVLKRATSFYLEHHTGMCYLSKFGIDNMNALRICILSDCPKARAIIHHAEDRQVILPSLEYLSVNSLWNLKSIVVGSVGVGGSFGALRCLTVRTCRKLSFVFTYSMVRNLLSLEELVIMDCESLKYIVIQDDMNNGYGDITSVNVGEFAVLPCLKVVKLHYLPNLIEIGINAWPSVEYMSFYNCPKLKKVDMTTDDAGNVKEIAAEKAWWDSLEWTEPALPERLNKVFT